INASRSPAGGNRPGSRGAASSLMNQFLVLTGSVVGVENTVLRYSLSARKVYCKIARPVCQKTGFRGLGNTRCQLRTSKHTTRFRNKPGGNRNVLSPRE